MINIIVPAFICIIICVGLLERKNTYSLFIEGIKDGMKTVYSIFPYIFAITIISGLLKDTQILKHIKILNIDSNLFSLILMKPLSGGASTALVTDIFKYYGPDSFIGVVASILMASTETTLYVISMLGSKIKVNNMWIVIVSGLIGDIVATILTICIAKYIF